MRKAIKKSARICPHIARTEISRDPHLERYAEAIAAYKKAIALEPTAKWANLARKEISEMSNRDARTKPHVASVLREPTTQPAGILPEGRSEKWIFVDGKWIKVVAATQRADK